MTVVDLIIIHENNIVFLIYQGEEKQFFALVKAMSDKKQVGLVRKVYQRNLAPKMNILVPCADVADEPWVILLMIIIVMKNKHY